MSNMRQTVGQITALVGVLALSGMIVPRAFGTDFSSWGHTMRIGFPGYSSQRTTLSGFPALVVLSTNLPGFAYSQFASPAGGDLRFAAANGTTELNYEIETWDVDGSSYVWVQVPQLAGTNTSIWASWGNPSQTTSPAYTTNGAVWADTYVAVWHFADASGVLRDSSGHGVEGTLNGGITRSVTGLAGHAFEWPAFPSTDDHVSFGANSVLGVTGTISIQAWFKTTAAASQAILSRFKIGGGYEGYEFNLGQNGAGRPSYYGSRGWTGASSGNYADGAWHQVCTVQDASTLSYFVDGSQNGSAQSSGGGVLADPAASAYLGRSSDNARPFPGSIDELRVSSVSLSPDWIWASWANVASPSTFASYGPVGSPNNTPVIENVAVTNLTLTSAELVGYLSATGTATTARAYWGTSDGGTVAAAWAHTNTFPGASGIGLLTTPVSWSTHNAMYFYRFYATNVAGEAWASSTASFLAGEVAVVATVADTTERPASLPGLFTVSRPPTVTQTDLVVHYTLGGTAVNGNDYSALSGHVTIPMGVATATVAVASVFDNENESSETVVLTLAPGDYIRGAVDHATVTIANVKSEVVTLHGVSSRDNTLVSGWASTRNQGVEPLTIGNASGADYRSLLWFDTSSIGRGSVVNTVSLRLTLVNNHQTDTDPYRTDTAWIYPVAAANANWGEGNKDAAWPSDATAGESCWDYAQFDTVRWRNSAGAGDYRGLGNPGDGYAATPVGSFTVFGYGVATLANVTATVALADVTAFQNWIDNPAANAGLLIAVSSLPNHRWFYYSREAANADYRPMLILNVTRPPAGTALMLR